MGGILGEATPTKAAETKPVSIAYSQTNIESKLNMANSKVSNLKEEMYKAQQEFEKLNKAINDVQTKINEKNQQMENTKKDIENLQKEINKIIERMEVRDGILKERARSYQESGGAFSYFNVVLGSQNFSDFIERIEAIAVVIGADQNILKEHQTDKETLEKSQSKMKSDLVSIETTIDELKKMEEELSIKKQEQNNSMAKLKEKERAVQVEVFALKETEKNQTFRQNNVQQSAVSISNNAQIQQTDGNSSFIWPTIGGVITTYQGMRWGAFHKGIDIARPSDYSILAASSGTVTYAGWINGYGNTIKIRHDNGYTTQYAHLASIKVKGGQSVSQGNTIGIMGSTGRSTGIHLDFEVYQNGRLLDPIDVLPGR